MSRVISGSAPAVPVNTSAPAFSGTPTVGQTLTGTNGTWTNAPTSYAYQHQTSPDGVSSWTNISGATSQNLSLTSGELGEYVRPGVLASNAAGPAASYAYGAAVGPVAAAPASLAPSGSWNGTLDSGGSPYTDPTRTGPKCGLRPLFPAMNQIGLRVWGTENRLWFDAQALGGIKWLNIKAEGGSVVTLIARTDITYTDANGVTKGMNCYEVSVDTAAFLALSSTGSARVSVQAVANNPAIQDRVFNFIIRPRSTEYGFTETVGSGKTYSTIDAGLAVARTRSEETCLVCDSNGGGQNISGGATYANSPRWITITHAVGATVTIGDGTTAGQTCAFDGLRFKGEGIKWDIAKLAYDMAGAWRMADGCTRLWLDGVTGPYCGTPNTGSGGSGSGSAALYNHAPPAGTWINAVSDNADTWGLFFTDCTGSEMPGYGYMNYQLRRHSTMDVISGSDNETIRGNCYGGWTSRCGGYSSGLMDRQGAFDLANAGPNTWEFAKTGSNGNNGNVELYKNGAGSPTYTYAVTANTAMSSVISWINGLGEAGLSASATTSTNDLGAAFITLSTLPRASAVPKTAVGSLLSVKRVVDIHADLNVWYGNAAGGGYQNVLITRFEGRDGEECAFISVNSDAVMKDIFLTNLSFQQDPAMTGGQPGYGGGTYSHWVAQNITNGNPSGMSLWGTFDAYCTWSRYAGSMAWSGSQSPVPAPNLVLQNLFCRASSVITGATGGNNTASNIAVASMVTDLNADPPDFTPLSPLQLPDSTWAGRYLPTGAEQTVVV